MIPEVQRDLDHLDSYHDACFDQNINTSLLAAFLLICLILLMLIVYYLPCDMQQTETERKRETKPSTTLFVVNFDVGRVRERDVEKHFEPYGAFWVLGY